MEPRIMAPAKCTVSRHVEVKKGIMVVADYELKTFEEIPVTLVNWGGPVPDNVKITEEFTEKVTIPLAEMYRYRITD